MGLMLASAAYWYTWFPGVALAIIGVLAVVWKGLTAFVRFNDALPVLLQAADEHFPNGGNTIKDDVKDIKMEQKRVARELILTRQRLDRRISLLEEHTGLADDRR